jgi:methylenetetrahydrofolate reductase (NADH)
MSRMNFIQRDHRKISVSFEFSPPKTPESEVKLWEAIKRLEPLAPEFMSVTYGAGGSTRNRTHATVKRIRDETEVKPAAHLTCVGATKEEVNEVIQSYWDAGIRHIVALRGDPPGGLNEKYKAHKGGYANAAELTKGIKEIGDFEVIVSAYPEQHPDSRDVEDDLDNLKRKIDNGASRAISQFFVEPDDFLRYIERARGAGINIPIEPGIMPVTNFKGYLHMAAGCGAHVPDWLRYRFEGLEQDLRSRQLVGATIAADQCASLYERGIDEFHFYTLNRADLAFAICHILGVRPKQEG